MPINCHHWAFFSRLTGDFAEAVRDQFVNERQEHFAELEQRLLDETRQQPECTRDNLAAAIMKMNPNLSEQQASFHTPGICHAISNFRKQSIIGAIPYM